MEGGTEGCRSIRTRWLSDFVFRFAADREVCYNCGQKGRRELVSGSRFVDAVRCDALCRGLRGRVEMLERVVKASNTQIFTDSTQLDVEKNAAYSGEE